MGHGGPTNVAVATKGINGQPKYKVTSLDNGYVDMQVWKGLIFQNKAMALII